jgi:hypothetical protein
VNVLDILMGRASRKQEEYRSWRQIHEQARREERERHQREGWDRQRSQAIMRAAVPDGELYVLPGDMNYVQTYAADGWWNRGNPSSALASSLHKLRDAMDMKRLTPDLDW